ncbi:unnamed protein product [Caenorhabditis auriculariae]|uniref:Nematode cuticle collagen N-terminal domain-containing protein n=1 Tax=Caenorhabditis auriculariae TaxID=2777116 RepID=A0A8S1GPD1_9PELO|nr:unnamed protein product [Caenorhabditis auriculariae]
MGSPSCLQMALLGTYIFTALLLVVTSVTIVNLFDEVGEFQRQIDDDLKQFKMYADESWTAMITEGSATRGIFGNAVRIPRQAYATGGSSAGGGGCNCGAQASGCPAGPPGPAGSPGEPGEPGTAGEDGKAGSAGVAESSKNSDCIQVRPSHFFGFVRPALQDQLDQTDHQDQLDRVATQDQVVKQDSQDSPDHQDRLDRLVLTELLEPQETTALLVLLDSDRATLQDLLGQLDRQDHLDRLALLLDLLALELQARLDLLDLQEILEVQDQMEDLDNPEPMEHQEATPPTVHAHLVELRSPRVQQVY